MCIRDREKLTKYKRVEEIIDDYYHVRLNGYTERKRHIIQVLEKELVTLSNKKRYIEETLEGVLDFRKMKKSDMIQQLKQRNYSIQDDDTEYKYLVKLPMDSVTSENVEKIMKEYENKVEELSYHKNTSEEEFWLEELTNFKTEYVKYLKRRENASQ